MMSEAPVMAVLLTSLAAISTGGWLLAGLAFRCYSCATNQADMSSHFQRPRRISPADRSPVCSIKQPFGI
jgi:hypothetical protein